MRITTQRRSTILAGAVRAVGMGLLVFFLVGCTAAKEHWEKCTRYPNHPDCEIERLPSGI